MEEDDARRRRWHSLLVAGTIAVGLIVDGAEAALIPSVSQRLRGRPLPSFASQTLDGQPFSSDDTIGRPVMQTLQPELRERGVSVSRSLSIRWRRRTRSMQRAPSLDATRFPSPW
jgi:hypothetical protein